MNNKIRELINKNFPKHPSVTSYRLSDGLLDDYCPIEKTFNEDWDTWNQIENWQILRSDTFLNFAPNDSFVYLIPRFMLFVIDDIEGLLPKECQASGVTDSVVMSLEKQLNIKFRNPLLTDGQLEVIKDCLDVFYVHTHGLGLTDRFKH